MNSVRWLGCVVAFLAASAHGQDDGGVHIPPELAEWRDWVLAGHEYRRCPFLYTNAATAPEDFVCAWPDTLEIDVAAAGGTFEQTWRIYGDEQWVPLPGDDEIWPREVTIDGNAWTVVLRDGTPSLRLPPGRHRIAGGFAWRERPAALAVPPRCGLLALTVDGQSVVLPKREEGRVWLAPGEREEQVRDAMEVNVFRRIEDQVPTRLETLFELSVSGGVREEQLGPALPDGFVPLALASQLPAQLAGDGDLTVQVRPGDWKILLQARAAEVLSEISLPEPRHNLPSTEIWSYEANPRLRTTVPEAARPVDPSQVEAPWDLPTFRLQTGETLAIVERSRGKANTDNEIELRRSLWLDFDGPGYTFADELTGVMRSTWRLAMTPPYALLAAQEQGHDLLVTESDAGTGVEIRVAELDVNALGRIEGRGAMPVIGWDTDVDTATMELNLPPGRKLLTAIGVDQAPLSWTGRWRLLDFFLLLIISVATARLFGRVPAAIALVALTLSFHLTGAPIWTWLNLLAAVALVRVAPEGRLLRAAKSYRLGSLALLLLFLVPFAIVQIRIALYPQLEPPTHRRAETFGLFEMLAGQRETTREELSHRSPGAAGSLITRPEADDGIALPSPPDIALQGVDSDEDDVVEERVVFGYLRYFARYGEDALLQTGPGKPDWEWTSYTLDWSGPVDATQDMRLVVLPSWLVSGLRLLSVVTLGLFAALFAVDTLGRAWRWPEWRWFRWKNGAAAAVVLAVALAGTTSAYANTPATEVLDELERRLLEPPNCVPRCAEIVAADLRADADDLTIYLEVHARDAVAVPVPGSAAGWHAQRIVAGGASLPAHQDTGGIVWTHLDAGRHTLTLSGPLPAGDTVEIAFPARPRVIAAESEHWFVTGIRDDTLPTGSIMLNRLRQTDEGAPAQWQTSRFPAFVRVERWFSLELDWRVDTTVHRLAPQVGAINIEVPLVAEEAVLAGDREVRDGNMVVAMDATQEMFYWHSSLPRQTPMTLQAAVDPPWHEVWVFRVDSTWRVDFEGVPESEREANRSGRYAELQPRPGETLRLAISQPEGAAGETLAFDNVTLFTKVGTRRYRAHLKLDYRSTHGSTKTIQLPTAARLLSVAVDGQVESLRIADGELNLPILPGEHEVAVAWDGTLDAGLRIAGLRIATPAVELRAPASNIVSTLDLPADRWLLFTQGPDLGPAILYWSELVALILAALVLGRFAPTPLRFHHWLLLGLGFSTFSWLAFAGVAAWLLVHGSHELWRSGLSRLTYNLSQIGFGILTLAAFAAILTGIPNGLLGNPDMTVTGYQSTGHPLTWFTDQTTSALPEGTVWSLPLWTYKALILAWALWLSFALVRWLPWVWTRFSERGLWQGAAKAVEESA